MRKCSLVSIILVILCALVVQGMGVAQGYGVVSVKLVVRDTKEEAWGYGQPIIRLAQPSGQGDTAVCTYSLVEIHAEVETLGVGDDDASGVRVEFISPSGEVHHVSAAPHMYRNHTWTGRLIPKEAGVWEYRILCGPSGSLGHETEIYQATFSVLPSGDDMPNYGRPWGTSVSKAEYEELVSLRYRSFSTRKLEQLIGDWDNHWQIPVRNQTLTDFGLIGTDLGQVFEHNGNLMFLFGDSISLGGFIESFVAYSTSQNPEQGLQIQPYTNVYGKILPIRPPGLSMGGYEVPSGGMSIDDKMYFLVKDRRTDVRGGQTFRSVLVHFDEGTKAFRQVREFSPVGGKFAETSARLSPNPIPGMSEGDQMLIFGSGEVYRQGSLYLAVTDPDQIEGEGKMHYFAGLGRDKQPTWTNLENEAVPVVKSDQIGEFSVIFVDELEIWLLAYNSLTPRGIKVHWSKTPWGPWSRSINIFDPWQDGGYTKFMHALTTPDPTLAGPVINIHPPAIEQWGGEYAPYMIERYTQYNEDTLTIYYLMSTWNPYVVVLMRTDFDVELARHVE